MHRLLPPILVTALIAVMVALSVTVSASTLPGPARIVGVFIAVGGAALTAFNARRFGKVETNIITFDDPDKLVRDGTFRWTRNPMYLGFLLLLIGIAAALGHPAAVIGPAFFFLVANYWYIPFEERRMHAVFGADYASYCSEVRRWI